MPVSVAGRCHATLRHQYNNLMMLLMTMMTVFIRRVGLAEDAPRNS